jgi:hypothetical protein
MIRPWKTCSWPSTSSGATVPKKDQTIAATWKASYCVGGYTAGHELSINVCEYTTPEAATAGRDMHKKVFPNLSNLETWSHGPLTLAIIQQKPDPSTAALKKKLADAFLVM